MARLMRPQLRLELSLGGLGLALGMDLGAELGEQLRSALRHRAIQEPAHDLGLAALQLAGHACYPTRLI
jgi:hypothetical protein